ncbi:MAG: ribonuclease P protein component [Acidobacteria bacterium]|nr:MAG: ribonuclease P protein component [Acidobacteriota bacterium]
MRSGRPFVALASSRFAAVYGRGRRSGDEGLVVISASGDSGPAQVGIVAGRGVGNAVRRNRAKRRLREALSLVELRPGTAYVVIASHEVVAMPFDRLVRRLAQAIEGTEE